jgi:hypothetical protein
MSARSNYRSIARAITRQGARQSGRSLHNLSQALAATAATASTFSHAATII